MPELPEIENLANDLRRLIVGRTLVSVDVSQPKMINLPPDEYVSKVRNQTITDVRRRAKYAVLVLRDGSLWLHLGLGGRVVLDSRQAKRTAAISFGLDDGSELWLERAFMGQAHFLDRDESDRRWKEMGLEPMGEDFTLEQLGKVLASRPKLPIKTVLTDQAVIAGIGNTYSDEILFAARLHPGRMAGSLSPQELRVLYAACREVLTTAVRQGGESDYIGVCGQAGRYRNQIHGAETCPRCGTVVQKATQRGRSTYLCPRCQPSV